MPPARLMLFFAAVMPTRTGPRKLAPIPLLTMVAPSLISEPVTPRSVLPPLRPAAHETPAGAAAMGPAAPVVEAAVPPVVPPDRVTVVPVVAGLASPPVP